MGQLWQRMAAMYGHKWTSSYGVEDDGTWRKGLSGLTTAQIGAGLVKCLERKPIDGSDWPPTLAEFRALCLPEREPLYHRHIDAREDLGYLRLPRPKMDAGQINEHLAAMRHALGKSPVQSDNRDVDSLNPSQEGVGGEIAGKLGT